MNCPIRFNSWQNLEMPLGVAYLAAVLERDGFNVTIRDFEVESYSPSDFRDFFKTLDPDILGISFRSSSVGPARVVSHLCRELKPGLKIVLGGHHATAFPEESLLDFEADAVVRGEGEAILPKLVHSWAAGKPPAEIAGVTWREGSRLISSPPAPPVSDLDGIPFPAWHLLPIRKYSIGSVLTSRGCPFGCIYCDKGVSTRQVRFRSPENVFREICAFENSYGKGRIYFVDDHLFLNRRNFLRLCDLLVSRDASKLRWTCQSRVDAVDLEVLEKARVAGCERIIFGVETGDPTELAYIGKETSLERAEQAISLARKVGIPTRANFMLGFPISTHSMVRRTIRFAERLGADLNNFFLVSPLPKTTLWERALACDPHLSNPDWSRFDLFSPAFPTVGISKPQLVDYIAAAYLVGSAGGIRKEFVQELLPRLRSLVSGVIGSKRLRGNLAKAFPALANLLIHEWKIFSHLPREKWLSTLRRSLRLAIEIRKGEDSPGRAV